MLRRMRAAGLVLIALVLGSCLAPSRLFATTVGGGLVADDLAVTLEDRTGLVQAFGPAQPGQFNLFDGVKADANPTVLVSVVARWPLRPGDAPGVRGGERRVLGHGDDRARSRLPGRERAPHVSIGLTSPIDASTVTCSVGRMFR